MTLALIHLLRLRHWSKNTFIFLPAFFAGRFFELNVFIETLYGFAVLSIVASGVYVFNDIHDREVDQLHPGKKTRPIASGDITIRQASLLTVFLFTCGLILSFLLNLNFFLIVISYIAINLLYSSGLKHIGILDLFLVSSGFILRTVAGGILTDIPISHWLLIMIFLLSLFLTLAKRMDDIVIAKEETFKIRKSAARYNMEFIQACLTMLSAIMIVSYIMYTLSDDVSQRLGTNNLFLTSVFVIAGVMRYLQIALVEHKSGSPIYTLFNDKFIIFTLIAWIGAFFLIIYYR